MQHHVAFFMQPLNLTWNFIRKPHCPLITCNFCLLVGFFFFSLCAYQYYVDCMFALCQATARKTRQNQFGEYFSFHSTHTQDMRSLVILTHLKYSNLFLSGEDRFVVLNCQVLFLLACSPIQIEWLTKIYLYDSSIQISALCCLTVQFGVSEIKAN